MVAESDAGEDYIIKLLNEYRASWALIRQWAGHDAAVAQREAEIQRLERLVWDAVYALQKAGPPKPPDCGERSRNTDMERGTTGWEGLRPPSRRPRERHTTGCTYVPERSGGTRVSGPTLAVRGAVHIECFGELVRAALLGPMIATRSVPG
jgi:hypothetical protein